MIVRNAGLQCLECVPCGEQVEIKRKVLSDPEQMLHMLEEMQDEHKPCEEFADDPARAKVERAYRVRMRCEVRRKR